MQQYAKVLCLYADVQKRCCFSSKPGRQAIKFCKRMIFRLSAIAGYCSFEKKPATDAEFINDRNFLCSKIISNRP